MPDPPEEPRTRNKLINHLFAEEGRRLATVPAKEKKSKYLVMWKGYDKDRRVMERISRT